MQSKFEQKNGTITVFKNKDKEEGDNRPDYTGPAKTEEGVELQVALWITESKNGLIYLSGKLQKPYKSEDSVPF